LEVSAVYLHRWFFALVVILCTAVTKPGSGQTRKTVAVLRFDNNTGDARYDHMGISLQVESTLSHYEITAKLGRGGMGILCQATDSKLNLIVALRVLLSALFVALIPLFQI